MEKKIYFIDVSVPNIFFLEKKPIWKNGKFFYHQDGKKMQTNHYCFKIPFLKKPYVAVFVTRKIND